jgi:hypothetical protein
MKLPIATAALVLITLPALAQDARVGVSTPPSSEITTTSEDSPAVPALKARVPEAKPSAAVPMTAAPVTTAPPAQDHGVYGDYVPYRPAGTTAPAPTNTAAFNPDANIVTETTTDAPVVDTAGMDSGIVTSVPERKGEIREGTLLKARIIEGLSTTSTLEGTPFSASLTERVEKDGRVILPVGSVIEGRVTEVHSGKRISGRAALHLEVRDVKLPDGTHYVIHAQLIDTDQYDHSNVNSEGTLVRRDHPKETLAAMSVATGGAAAAGAMMGGGVGALVGAGVGAGVSTVIWLKQDRQEALPKDSLLVFSLTTPMVLKPLGNRTVSSVTTPKAAPYTAVATVPVE